MPITLQPTKELVQRSDRVKVSASDALPLQPRDVGG
jgi:hypothetical protein